MQEDLLSSTELAGAVVADSFEFQAGSATPADPTSVEWVEMIAAATKAEVIQATTLVKELYKTFSWPLAINVEGGQTCVVKAPNRRHPCPRSLLRSLVNEQISGALMIKAGGPTPPIKLVEISGEFIAASPPLSGLAPAVCHGSCIAVGCDRDSSADEKQWLSPKARASENRRRFASICLLYGWLGATDPHVIYGDCAANLVWSVDHGHFLGGTAWTVENLGRLQAAAPVQEVAAYLDLDRDELRDAAQGIEAITPADVAEAVARPPDAWGLSAADRANLAGWIWSRRSELLASVAAL